MMLPHPEKIAWLQIMIANCAAFFPESDADGTTPFGQDRKIMMMGDPGLISSRDR
jgi:hypothetical protein